MSQDRPLSLNSIHCNPARPWQFAVAGGDQFVRVYDRRKAASVSSAEATASEAANLDNPIQQNKNYAAALATPVWMAQYSFSDADVIHGVTTVVK